MRPSKKKKRKKRNTGRNEGCGQKELLYTVGGNVNYGSWREASSKLKVDLPNDPAI